MVQLLCNVGGPNRILLSILRYIIVSFVSVSNSLSQTQRPKGTQTVPPCYGQWFEKNNRRQTNHWRVMKDPIRISRRQLVELNRLLRERIAPKDDPVAACKKDTAAKVDRSTGKVDTARPLQSNHKAHYTVFCECDNWTSKWKEDQEWCRLSKRKRFFQQPYNFKTTGF